MPLFPHHSSVWLINLPPMQVLKAQESEIGRFLCQAVSQVLPGQAARCVDEAPPGWEGSAQVDSARGSSE